MHNPLDHFDGKKADKLLTYCEKLFGNEEHAWLHLICAAFALCQDNKINHLLLDCLERSHDQATEEQKSWEQTIERGGA